MNDFDPKAALDNLNKLRAVPENALKNQPENQTESAPHPTISHSGGADTVRHDATISESTTEHDASNDTPSDAPNDALNDAFGNMLTDAFTDVEVRVLGCLVEKARITPDNYPLTLNSLRLACNQTSSRDPIVQWEPSQVGIAVRGLIARGLVAAEDSTSRAEKYRHRLAERWQLPAESLAVLCMLMLRGAQTVSEIRTRSKRIHAFSSAARVEEVLESLIARETPMVARLAKQPGSREVRYVHCLQGAVDSADIAVHTTASASPRAASLQSVMSQMDALTARVAHLEAQLGIQHDNGQQDDGQDSQSTDDDDGAIDKNADPFQTHP